MRFTYQTGAQPLDGYTIQRGIHRGGFGEVYFAHSHSGKEVALKLLHQQDQDVEIRGVTQCLNLKHPNLINLHDLRSDQHGDYWVVMEYVSGSSLEDVLTSFPDGLPLNEIGDWITGLVAGVAFLHDRGIVHRDLKPANIYREAGLVKVGDVGLSKRLSSERRQHTQSVGTVYYMAPEVAKGQYGPEVDVYSLGVILYEMVSGRLPFSGETTAEILMKHLTAQPDLSCIPKPLRGTIARALEKDPARRTPDVRQFGVEVRSALAASTTASAVPDTLFDRSPFSPADARNWWTNAAHQLPHCRNEIKGRFRKFIATAASLSIALPLTFILTIIFVRFARTSVPFPLVFVILGAVIGGLTLRRLISLWRASRSDETAARTAWTRTSNTVPSGALVESWTDIGPRLANSLGISAFLSSGFIAVAAAWLNSGATRSTLFPSVEHTAMLAATSTVGCWVILIGQSLTQTSLAAKRRAGLLRLVAGLLVGLAGYGLSVFLNVDVPTTAYTAEAIVSAIGQRQLLEVTNPTWIGFSLFFALWMALNRWSRDLNPERRFRIHPVSILFAIGSAYVISTIYAFPQWYAMLLAATISTSIQFAAFRNPRQIPLATRP